MLKTKGFNSIHLEDECMICKIFMCGIDCRILYVICDSEKFSRIFADISVYARVINSERLSENRSPIYTVEEEMSGFMKYDIWQGACDGCNYRKERGSTSVTERKTEATWKSLQTLKVIQI